MLNVANLCFVYFSTIKKIEGERGHMGPEAILSRIARELNYLRLEI